MQSGRGRVGGNSDAGKTPTHPGCVLTIQAPGHRCDKFQKILKPVLRHFDPSSCCVHVSEDETLSWNLSPDKFTQHGGGIPRYQDNRNILSTPALAVMLFLQERGETTTQDVQKYFKRYPWRVHHKIELQTKRSPTVKVGQQEFYSLSREYPLWSVCPVYAGFEHLRLSLFVSRFSEMVEFYRLLTDTEMESTKPDFCLFPLGTEGEFKVMLCLKRCRQLRPFPLTRAYLSFKVRNILILKKLLRGELQEIAHNRYLIKDPDGNVVILEDMNIISSNSVEYENDVTSRVADVTCDVTSVKSVCGSNDSGRYSDSDQCSSDLDHKGLKKAVHFNDSGYNRTWIYHSEPMTSLKDQTLTSSNGRRSVKCDTTSRKRDNDMCYDEYYDDTQRCYPGMVIAHARLITTQEPPTSDESGRDQLTSTPKPPTVTVTDCSGNVHNCIERVIYPSECRADYSIPLHEHDSWQGHIDSYDSGGQLDSHWPVFPTPTSQLSWPCGSSGELSRRQYEHQNDLDLGQTITSPGSGDGRGSIPVLGEGRLGGATISSGPRGGEDCENEAERRLREEVIKKRLVKAVYI